MSEFADRKRAPGGKGAGARTPAPRAPALQDNRTPNRTGMPDALKAGVESLSGHDLSDVRVHRDSDKPARLNAHAYAQGNEIHLGPGQARHLPHEAWHLVQQRQGRVKATTQVAGAAVNDDPGLEHEADVMGARAASSGGLAAAPGAARGHGAVVPAQRRARASEVRQLSLIGDLTRQTLGTFLAQKSLGALLGFADKKALDLLGSYSTFKLAYDTVLSFTNALTLAISIWESIPAPVRTGILFLTGKLMLALPLVNRVVDTESLIVDADKDVKDTYLVWAVEQLKTVMKIANSPVSSAISVGKYLYSSWWSGGDKGGAKAGGQTPAQVPKPSERRGDLASLNLRIIWLNVKALHLEKGKQQGEGMQEGGLHADFQFGVNLFDHSFSLGEVQDLTLILPWSGGAILRSVGPVPVIKDFSVGDLFEVKRLDMTMLDVSNEGLRELTFHMGRLAIGGEAIVMAASTANYLKGKGLDLGSEMTLKMYDWRATAKLDLSLDQEGGFKEGKVTGFKESSGALKVGGVTLSKEKGFALHDAELDLEPSTKLDLKAKLAELVIKDDTVTGRATLVGNEIPLLGDKIKLAKVGGAVDYGSHSDWQVGAHAELAMGFDAVKASGQFSISYASSSGATDVQMKNGQFKADYAGITVTASGMAYDHVHKRFTLASAQLNIEAIKTQTEVKDVTIDKDGVAFKQMTIDHKAPIVPFKGVTINNAKLTLEKAGERFNVAADADLDVAIGSPTARAAASGMRLSFDDRGWRGEVGAFTVHTTPFNLAIGKAGLDKQGLRIDKAMLSFNTGGNRASDHEAGAMIHDLRHGLLDFLPIGPIAFEADNVVANHAGLRVGSFKPKIPAVGFNAFGIGGHVDFDKMTAELSASHQLSLAQMTGLPLSASVFFPVFPGLEVYGSLEADANLGVGFKLNAGAEAEYWAVNGGIKVNAGIKLTAGLGAQLGAQALVALSAGLFAEGKAELKNASANISGSTRYDRAAKKFVTGKPLQVDYDFSSAAIVSVGGEIKVKALYFFSKTLYRYTAGEWTLGEYVIKGKLGDKAGELDALKAEKLGLDREKAEPAPTSKLDQQSADRAMRADVLVINSAEARLALLKQDAANVSKDLARLHEAGRLERAALAKLESRYFEVMDKKARWADDLAQAMSADAVNNKLAEFNVKYGVERLQQTYSTRMTELERIQGRIDTALKELRKLDSVSSAGMDEGVKSKLDEVDALSDIVIPPSASLENGNAELARLVTGLDEEAVRHQRILEKFRGVMSASVFLGNSTTKGVIGDTTRKTIVPVDDALGAFHAAPDERTLRELTKQIGIYLARHSTERTAVVLLLQSQVDEALKAMR